MISVLRRMFLFCFCNRHTVGIYQTVNDAVLVAGVEDGSSLHMLAKGMAERPLSNKSDGTNKNYLNFCLGDENVSFHLTIVLHYR